MSSARYARARAGCATSAVAASITFAALAATAFSSTLASSFSVAIAASLASTAPRSSHAIVEFEEAA